MIDLIASQPQYLAHLDPLWAALPDELRGMPMLPRMTRQNDAAIVASSRDLAAARRLGYKRIAYLEHGIGQSYSSDHAAYPGGAGRGSVDLFLSPNRTAANRDQVAYPDARVEVVGDPRLNSLPALEGEPGTVAISWHWECGVAPETRPALSHFRKALEELAAVVPLIGHAHPRAAQKLEPIYRRLGIEFVPTFDEVCRRASLYVCDNSSTIYEFASTGRPVVVLNAPWYRRDVHHGLRFWDAATVGLQVDDPARLVDEVVFSLRDPAALRQRRERALRIVYGYRHGAAERAAGVIVDWMRSSEDAAA